MSNCCSPASSGTLEITKTDAAACCSTAEGNSCCSDSTEGSCCSTAAATAGVDAAACC